jgi:DNA repair protein RAD7
LIEECQSLNDLRLKEMKVDDDWLREIGESNALKALDLSSPATSCSEDALVGMLCAIGPRLSALNLSSHESVTDGFLEDGLGKWTGSLERLSLVGCPELTDRAVSRLFNAWAGGGDVDGTDSQQAALSPEQVDAPVRLWNRRSRRAGPQRSQKPKTTAKNVDAPSCHNVPLVAIEMGRNHLLGSRSLISILQHSGTRLESLSMNGWKEVTVESLQELGNYGQELRKLDVGWCRNVDDFVLAGWVGIHIPIEGSDRTTNGSCLKLNEIKVWGCNRVTGKFPIRVSESRVDVKWHSPSYQRGVTIHGIESQTF